MRYPIELDFRKSLEENQTQLLWLKKIDNIIIENFKDSKQLQSFGTHLNIRLIGWENYTQKDIDNKIREFKSIIEAIDLGDDNVREIVGLVPFGGLESSRRLFKHYEVFSHRSLSFDLDLVKVYEQAHKNNKLETPYRLFLKELFRYADHVALLTFRNYSLDQLINNQMDSRKHISFDTV